ncbi:MAG: rhomboid family intramembrane serine protease [Rhodovibrionaceae bacterium]
MSLHPDSGGAPARSRRLPGGGGPRPQRLKVPRAIWALLAVMLGLHLLRLSLPEETAFEIVYALALIIFESGRPLDPERFYTLVTHAFLHGNWLHIFFNGLWLLILGSRLHLNLGETRFLIFFALTAAGGGAAQILLDWGQVAILIGASGVVFGLLGAGAYLWVLQPGDRGVERIRKLAWYCVVMMLLNVGYAVVGGFGNVEKIAWEAHAGGFFTGLAIFPLLRRRQPVHLVEPDDDA